MNQGVFISVSTDLCGKITLLILEHCEEKPKEIYCIQCTEVYCSSCFITMHSSKLKKNHEKKEYNPKEIVEMKCKEHLNDIMTLFCQDCELPICVKCSLNKHKTHKVFITSEIKENLIKDVESLLKEVPIDVYKKEIQDLKNQMKEIEDKLLLIESIEKEYKKTTDTNQLILWKKLLNNSMGKSLSIKWSLISSDMIYISEYRIKKTQNNTSTNRMAYTNMKISAQSANFTVGFKIISLVSWIGLGFSRLEHVMINQKWNAESTDKAWLISSNGYLWNESSENGKSLFETFQTKDIIQINVIPSRKKAIYSKNGKEFGEIFIDFPCVLCANLCSTNEEIEILQ